MKFWILLQLCLSFFQLPIARGQTSQPLTHQSEERLSNSKSDLKEVESNEKKMLVLLWEAAETGDLELLKTWSGDFDAADEQGETALIKSCDSGRFKFVEFLLTKKVNFEKRDKAGFPALFYAISAGHAEIVRLLLKAGALVKDLDRQMSEDALFEAARVGKAEILELLVQHEPSQLRDLNRSGETALFMALRFFQVEAFSQLL
ncbi:MAG: ankyrin repeat domain-containing protein, partial [Bdellovibrio sp.]